MMLPGWYGVGSAVLAFRRERGEEGLALLKEMYARWPYFRSLISMMDMVLAKVDLAIASRYASLVGQGFALLFAAAGIIVLHNWVLVFIALFGGGTALGDPLLQSLQARGKPF